MLGRIIKSMKLHDLPKFIVKQDITVYQGLISIKLVIECGFIVRKVLPWLGQS